MKTLSLPFELRAAFDARVLAYNSTHNDTIADCSRACYVDGVLCIQLFIRTNDGQLVEAVARSSSAPFAVALEAAIAEFRFAAV